jgi:hypothetical protein
MKMWFISWDIVVMPFKNNAQGISHYFIIVSSDKISFQQVLALFEIKLIALNKFIDK